MTQRPTLENELNTALGDEDLDAFVTALDKRGSSAAAVGADPGTAKVPEKRLAARLTRAHFKNRPRDLFNWTQQLLGRAEPNAHEVGLLLLPDVYDRDPKFAQRQLLFHANSSNWEVREFAGSMAGRVLDGHFDDFYPILKEWTKHTSENVRRAVVIATMEAAKKNHPKRGPKLLRLLDPLMNDEARYVRVNLGQFAISLALLKNYPELTLKWLHKHARRTNENARWNVAMVWSAVGGRRHAKEGVRLLQQLAADERRFVWRAVAAATVKLGKAKPEVVKPLLKKWKTDPKRKHVAEVVERYL
jgi:3-methyladenine DNA glycosylase AlkC